MPDWLTHILVAWTLCTILGFRFKTFNPPNIAICMVGALIPDIVKISIPLTFFGYYSYYLIAALHTPAGSTIIASIISMFFKEKKLIFGLLLLGAGTHFLMDLLLNDIGAGIYLFYPLSWSFWQIGLFSNTDYLITIISTVVALTVYFISIYINKTGHKRIYHN